MTNEDVASQNCVFYSHADMQKFYEATKPFFDSMAQSNLPFGDPYPSDNFRKGFTVAGKALSLFGSAAGEGQIDEYGYSESMWVEFEDTTPFSANNVLLASGCVVLGAWPRRKRHHPTRSSMPDTLPPATGKFARAPLASPPPPPPTTGEKL